MGSFGFEAIKALREDLKKQKRVIVVSADTIAKQKKIIAKLEKEIKELKERLGSLPNN